MDPKDRNNILNFLIKVEWNGVKDSTIASWAVRVGSSPKFTIFI